MEHPKAVEIIPFEPRDLASVNRQAAGVVPVGARRPRNELSLVRFRRTQKTH
jgi:hypothetical protein